MKRAASVLFVFLFTASCMLLAAPPRKKTPVKMEIPKDVPAEFKGRESQWLYSALSEEYLVERMTAIADDFKKGRNGKMLTVPECKLCSMEVERFGKYYFFESDSGVQIAWQKSCLKYTQALTKAQEKIRYLVISGQTGSEEYRQWYEYYKKTAGDFARLAAKPAKSVNRQKIASLNRIKKVVLEREKAKEEARKNAGPKLDDRPKKK